MDCINDHSEDHGETLIPADNERFIIIDSEGQGKSKPSVQDGSMYNQTIFFRRMRIRFFKKLAFQNSTIHFFSSPCILHRPGYDGRSKYFPRFLQSMELMSIIGMTKAGITMGWWHMANGANMVYHTSYANPSNKIPSMPGMHQGDDMF